MKKRPEPKIAPQRPVVPPEILESARRAAYEPKPKKTFRCRVCAGDGATEQSEMLCWVCRRLKISAWREGEQPASLSE